MNAYGHEVHPSPNPDYIMNLSTSDVLVYSCGSLWTRCVISLTVEIGRSEILKYHSLFGTAWGGPSYCTLAVTTCKVLAA